MIFIFILCKFFYLSGVTEFGLFVQLTDTMTEGLVPIRTIEKNDYMQFDEENYCLIAARSGKTYTLSDPVRVKVTKVDVERKLNELYRSARGSAKI